jgi:hypothetical protein
MTIKLGVLIGALVVTTSDLNAQQGLTLTVGRLIYSNRFVQQNVSVKNDTSKLVRDVKVECGFFSKGELIATDSAYVENIAPGATGFKTLTEPSDVAPDRAECRIVSVR